MRFLEEILYLSYLGGIGRGIINREYVPWRYWRNEEPDLSVPEEWLRLTGRILTAEEDKAAKRETQKVLEWLYKHQETEVYTVFDQDYPARLSVMGNQRPPAIYIKGSINNSGNEKVSGEGNSGSVSIFSRPSLAVIGSRWPGDYALRNGFKFARMLAEQAKMPIISGLARGCDRIGHCAAMDVGVPTVAVMACGPDTIVPDINRDLAERIADGHGFLMTEYPPGTSPADYRYVERDRITAALSSAAVVIECGIRSGTMQTVKAALSYGRPVACWYPSTAESSGYEGNRYMLEHLGAFRITDNASLTELLNTIRLKEKELFQEPEQISLF